MAKIQISSMAISPLPSASAKSKSARISGRRFFALALLRLGFRVEGLGFFFGFRDSNRHKANIH